MRKISIADILDLGTYEKQRNTTRSRIMAVKIKDVFMSARTLPIYFELLIRCGTRCRK